MPSWYRRDADIASRPEFFVAGRFSLQAFDSLCQIIAMHGADGGIAEELVSGPLLAAQALLHGEGEAFSVAFSGLKNVGIVELADGMIRLAEGDGKFRSSEASRKRQQRYRDRKVASLQRDVTPSLRNGGVTDASRSGNAGATETVERRPNDVYTGTGTGTGTSSPSGEDPPLPPAGGKDEKETSDGRVDRPTASTVDSAGGGEADPGASAPRTAQEPEGAAVAGEAHAPRERGQGRLPNVEAAAVELTEKTKRPAIQGSWFLETWNRMAGRGDCPLVSEARSFGEKLKKAARKRFEETGEPASAWPQLWAEFCANFAASDFASGRSTTLPGDKGEWDTRRGLEFALREKHFGPILERTHWSFASRSKPRNTPLPNYMRKQGWEDDIRDD